MNSITGLIGLERPQLFALELGKYAEVHFIYTLASTDSNQSALNSVKMYVTNKSLISSIMSQIGSDRSELSALELEKIAIFDLVYEASPGGHLYSLHKRYPLDNYSSQVYVKQL